MFKCSVLHFPNQPHCSAMMKHGVEGNPEDFTLSQLLPDKGEERGRKGGREEGVMEGGKDLMRKEGCDASFPQSCRSLLKPMFTTRSTRNMTSTLCSGDSR